MPERCFGEYARMRSSKYRQCTNDAVFELEWTGKPVHEEFRVWSSWVCAHHLSQVVRWAFGAMEVRDGSMKVTEYESK